MEGVYINVPMSIWLLCRYVYISTYYYYLYKMVTKFTINLPDEIDAKFRKAVFKRKGMKRGNLSEAVVEAFEQWSERS